MAQRTWFITGINSGFGREMTEQLLERGDRVLGTVRRPDPVKDLKDRYGDSLLTAQLDVTDPRRIQEVVDKAFADLGKIDVIVNNAGYGLFGPVEGLTEQQILHQINTNLLGSIFMARAAIPHLRSQGGGRILQLSTYGGQAALPGGSLYHAGKWGIEGFMEAMSMELAPFNIGVTIVEPGGAGTNFRGAARENLGKPLAAYEKTPASFVFTFLQDSSRVAVGDPVKIVHEMIKSVDQAPAPKRLVLGSDSYTAIQKALADRLASVEAQKELASATDLTK